ncbi:phosphodiester glycosidase family protein [Clostridiaceae bacterium 35-E11]
MKKTQKWIAVVLVLFTLLTLHTQPFVYADWTHSVYETSQQETIAKGVTHQHMLKFTNKGWLNMHLLRVDLKEQSNALDILINENGLSEKARLSQLVDQNPHIVGAVNGDFFNIQNPGTLGPIVRDGGFISTPFYMPDKMATFNVTKDKQPFIDFWTTPQLDLINKDKPVILQFATVNKSSDYHDTAILFTPVWGEKTPPLSEKLNNAVEMVVENNQVKDIVFSSEGTSIPKDGYVIWATGSFANTVLNSFAVGDEVELLVNSNPDFNQLAMTLGGGTILVKDGIPLTTFTHEIKGNHPRTALGISKDQEEVIFLTIDGRTSSYTGVSQAELAQIMTAAGAWNAINLDGGGSTEMILRPQGEAYKKIVNNLSDGSERRIMNGIGIVNTAPQTGEIGGIKLETVDTNIFVNTSRTLTLKAHDTNYHPINIQMDQVKWHIEGVSGSFYGNVFKPSSTGKGIITAEYQGQRASMSVNVLDEPVKLTFAPKSLTLDIHQQKTIQSFGINSEGYKALIHFQDLHTYVPANLGRVDSNGVFWAGGQGASGIIEASLDDLKAYLPIAVGSDERIIEDFEQINGTFLSYPAEVTGDYTLASMRKSGNASGKLSYDFTTTDATRAAYLVFDNGGITLDQLPAKLGMWVYGNEGGGHWIRAKLTDADGTSHTLNFASNVNWDGWKYIEAAVPRNIKAPISLERIYVVETDAAMKNKGSIYIDDLTVSIPISLQQEVPNVNSSYQDERNIKSELSGENAFQFFAFGAVQGSDLLTTNPVLDEIAATANGQATFNVFAGTVHPQLSEKLQHPMVSGSFGYSATQHKNSLFIKLDNTKGGLRESNFAQWSWFMETLDHTNAKNIFVVLPNALTFKDKLEEKLFKDTLAQVKENRNADVWVLTGGNKGLTVTPEEGIRYVSLPSYAFVNEFDNTSSPSYIRFTVNEDQVTYEMLTMSQETR